MVPRVKAGPPAVAAPEAAVHQTRAFLPEPVFLPRFPELPLHRTYPRKPTGHFPLRKSRKPPTPGPAVPVFL
jgi:hypothetical protein